MKRQRIEKKIEKIERKLKTLKDKRKLLIGRVNRIKMLERVMDELQ